MNTAIIGLGSNIRPQEHIALARTLLAKEFKVIAESEFRTTKPVGDIPQADFINGGVRIETDLDRTALTSRLKTMEETLGRKKGVAKFGPRTIDLDVITFNGTVVDPDYSDRDYLRRIVAELQPQKRKA